jgi:hypothetical protein
VVSERSGHRIRKLVLSTWDLTTVAGSPTYATGAADGVGTLASFNGPAGVLLTSDDLMVYVADRNNNKIRRVELSSQRVSTVVAASGSVALNQPFGLTWIETNQWLMISSNSSHHLHEMYGLVNPLESPLVLPPSTRLPRVCFVIR